MSWYDEPQPPVKTPGIFDQQFSTGRPRNERTERAALEPHFPKANGLTDLITFLAMFFAAIPRQAVLGLDSFPVRAGVLIVIHLAVRGWIFR